MKLLSELENYDIHMKLYKLSNEINEIGDIAI